MSQMTVRGLSPELEKRLRETARQRGISLNRTVVALLSEATGLVQEESKAKEHNDLDHLFGRWTRKQGKEFMEALREMRTIGKEEWK